MTKIEKITPNIITVIFTGKVDLFERKLAVTNVCKMKIPSIPFKLLIDVIKITMDMTLEEQVIFGEYPCKHNRIKRC